MGDQFTTLLVLSDVLAMVSELYSADQRKRTPVLKY